MTKKLNNWIDGKLVKSSTTEWIEKINPHNQKVISLFPCTTKAEVNKVINIASKRFKSWSSLTSIQRGAIINKFVSHLKKNEEKLAKCISNECGKSLKDATGEVGAAITQGHYFASEGMRMYGKTLSSNVQGKVIQSVRCPIGVAALIVPANTPIANIAWKVFPALICGNTVVLKSSEDAPETAELFVKISKKAGIPDGVLNMIHGNGHTTGEALIDNKKVKIISFTGSTLVGKYIAKKSSDTLKRISLELGGKNPIVIYKDADIENAIKWTLLSAFSNAGQRCASASRVIVHKDIYQKFKNKLLVSIKTLKLGIDSKSDLGPVINKKQFSNIINYLKSLPMSCKILIGGKASSKKEHKKGYYIEPTVIEDLPSDTDFLNNELFAPVCSIEPFKNINEAIEISNATDYGLTSAIHTKDLNIALKYSNSVYAGTVNINMGTYGSEPHMPFGGFGDSGNGTREPGLEALDVYTEIKNISFFYENN